MALYEYRGLNRQGKNVKGNIDAENQRAARIKLKREGIFIQSLKDKQKSKKKKSGPSGVRKTSKVKVDDLALFTRQMATLIKANIPLVECLAAVSDQMENQLLKEVAADIRDSVNEGIALNKAMARYPNIFSTIYLSMVEAGEASGTLDLILIRLAEFTESQNELKNKLKSAMMYPAIMVLFTIVVVIVLFMFVIPKITAMFDDMDLTLPWYSKLVIDLSGFMIEYWLFLLVSVVVSVVLFLRWKSTPKGSAQYDKISLKLPVIGKLVRMVAVSRFTKTLGTLLTGGVPMLQSLDIVKNVVDNQSLEAAITAARNNISEGESIAGPLKRSQEFPPIVIHMISIGEKTGDLENMLTQISEAYDFQVKNSIDGLTSLLEPVMIVIMGMVIAVIVFAIMVPIFELSNIPS